MAFNWRKFEAWRQHPMLINHTRHSMPGLGLGIAAFAAYFAYDQAVGGAKKAAH